MAEPIYGLHDFEVKAENDLCYVNKLSAHLRTHHFVNAPHRHDFFMVILITRGSGKHSIDFVDYPVRPDNVFVMQPGQLHHWQLSADIEGFICLHSREFYEEFRNSHLINELPFFRSLDRSPYLKVTRHPEIIADHFKELYQEYQKVRPLRNQKLRIYLSSLYLDISRMYGADERTDSPKYLTHLRIFQNLLEKHFIEFRRASHYAQQMKVTTKHLNRITQTCLGKTATEVIADRVVLEAKRLLGENELSVTEVAYYLNFSDLSYFTRFFKKHTDKTPLAFIKKINHAQLK